MTKFVITCCWGEWDDYTKHSIFITHSKEEAELFATALNNKEPDLWEKVIAFFANDGHIPSDIYFSYEELEVLSLE